MRRLLLTAEEVAEALGCKRTRAWSLIRTGQIKSVKFGGMRRVAPEDLEAFVEGLRSAAK